MSFTLTFSADNIKSDSIIKNPSVNDIENAIQNLMSNPKNFLILDSDVPIDTIMFIQATGFDGKTFYTEVQCSECDGLYMYCNEILDEKGLLGILLDFISNLSPNIEDWTCAHDVSNYKFYKEYSLRKLLKEKGLTVLKCKNVPSNSIQLETSDIQVLLNYMANNQIGNIFYCYHFINKDAYNFSNVNISKDNDLLKIAQKDICEYNNKIESLDFSQPAVLELFCLHNGIAINIQIIDSWLNDVISAREYLSQLEQKYAHELADIKSYRNMERENVLEELRAILLEKSDFELCTNQNLRREFMRKFLSQKENEKYRQAFIKDDGYLNSNEVANFADLVYSVLKKLKAR